ncbi:hypothetical protein [Roseibium album]|uniref:Uncharacterized protein n=1 Tax=Roseibium album TaxID=311410 RepID=A0A0M6ZF38_9HYPH|nr:hypothetical protein [Roseibium album]CTQ60790.1 hypothetical protein LA5094_03568 [Roseibium album]CTQ65011.1 hypothetical protein LA5095_00400 [Roseibium album]CTQ73132.1 hypothetical protein LA5096_03540 [Roseibium album]
MSEKSSIIDDVSDVVDFFLAWNNHRETVLKISEMDQLDSEQKKTLRWLVKMADRVSLTDLEKDELH